MPRRKLNLLLDWGLLAAALVVFPTGLVILLGFHVGQGASAAAAFGIGKLVWLNTHRLSAILFTAGVTAHAALHWPAFRHRLTNSISGKTGRRVDSEPLMYAAFGIASAAALIAWWIVRGASPLFGPAATGAIDDARHRWIDTHLISSLALLALVAHHFGHRWRFMASGPARRANTARKGV